MSIATVELKNIAEGYISQLLKADKFKTYLTTLPNLSYEIESGEDKRTPDEIAFDEIFHGVEVGFRNERFYSRNNSILIFMEFPNAQKVCQFDYWKEHNCSVRAGQHGVKLVKPVRQFRTNPKTKKKEYYIAGYDVYTAHDFSQTTAKMVISEKKHYVQDYDRLKSALEKMFVDVKIEYTNKVPKFKYNKNIAQINASLEGEKLLRILIEGLVKVKKAIINDEKKRLNQYDEAVHIIENNLIVYTVGKAYGLNVDHLEEWFEKAEAWSDRLVLDFKDEPDAKRERTVLNSRKKFFNLVYTFSTEIMIGVNRSFREPQNVKETNAIELIKRV